MLKKLNRSTSSLPQNHPIKVLQFGSGNFLRGFADWMIDILNEKTNFNGGIQIVQSVSSGKDSKLNEQQGLYHVVVSGIKEGKPFNQTRLITCVAGTINPQEDIDAYLKTSVNPDLKFVISNTTESGICFNREDKYQMIASSTFPGKLTALLHHRYIYFKGAADRGLIIMPCELIEKNGEILKNIVIQYAELWKLPGDFCEWITRHNTFCNTLVDRIVPGFPKETIKDIQLATGYEDNLVVMAEPFYLWVIEGPDFVKGVFPAEQAHLDVKFTDSLAGYRTRKVRILNGAHTTLVPVAYLKGFRTVRESIEDKEIGSFLREAIFEEIIPTLDLPADELKKFADDTIERFLNPTIRHELISISLNSISKFKVRVLPSILRYIALKQQMPERLLYSLAALIRFYKGSWRSENIPVNDAPDVLAFFKERWSNDSLSDLVRSVLSNSSLWGQDLTSIKGIHESVLKHLTDIQHIPTRS